MYSLYIQINNFKIIKTYSIKYQRYIINNKVKPKESNRSQL